MAGVQFTNALKDEYQRLFDQCQMRAGKLAAIETLLASIKNNRQRYAAVSEQMNVPWQFVGIVHNMESSLNFNKHLHNGDPLAARTVQVPAGRPKSGDPPFTWEVSAADALGLENLGSPNGWSIPLMLYKLERYNGFGYRLRSTGINSPYLWSFSNHYNKGKFVKDGRFDPEATSAQCGAAVLLRRMAETGLINFDHKNEPIAENGAGVAPPAANEPLVRFSNTEKTVLGMELQKALNRFPGIFVLEDGKTGTKTSDALKRVTGHFLSGDPRD